MADQNRSLCRHRHKTLHNIACVNLQLYQCAQQELWALIGLHGTKNDFTSQLSQLVELLDQRQENAELMKRLDVMTMSTHHNQPEALALTKRLFSHTANLQSLAIDVRLIDFVILGLETLSTLYLLFPSSIDRSEFMNNLKSPDLFPQFLQRAFVLPSLRTLHIEDGTPEEVDTTFSTSRLSVLEYFPICVPGST